MNTYDLGDTVRTRYSLKVGGSTLTDPTTLTVKIKNPAGTVTTYVYGVDAAVVRESTGAFYVDVLTTDAGYWFYRAVGTGTAAGAGERRFYVRSSQFS